LIAVQVDNLESLIQKAKEQEKKYEWLQAAEVYQTASDTAIKHDDLKIIAQLYDKRGFCFFKAAFQAQSNKQFIKTMKQAIENYEKAADFYRKTNDETMIISANNLVAQISYSKSWIEKDTSKKTILIEEWWILKSKILETYEKLGDRLSVAQTCIDLLQNSYDCYYWIGKNLEELKEKRNRLLSLGEKAINILSELNKCYELARAYYWTSSINLHSNTHVIGLSEEKIRKCSMFIKKSLEISKKIGDPWLLGWCYYSASQLARNQNDHKAQTHYLKLLLELGETIKDNYLLGMGRFQILASYYFVAMRMDDPDVVRQLHKSNLQTAKKIIQNFQIINMSVWNPYYPNTLAVLGAASAELDSQKKYYLLKKAVEYGRKCVALTDEWKVYISPIQPALAAYNLALSQFSEFVTKIEEKKDLLEELLENTKRARKNAQLNPFNLYSRALIQRFIVSAKYELSKIANDKMSKIDLLNDAITAIKVYKKIVKRSIEQNYPEYYFSVLGGNFYFFGKIFYHMYLLTEEPDLLLDALEVYDNAIELFSRLDYLTGIAEANWQRAKIHEQLGKLLEAKNDYEAASETYLKTASKVPQLDEFYREHSSYMKAWSQIEQAKSSHLVEDYEQANEHYKQAAELHKLTSSWNYLTPNYFAWANVEKAEALSRKEETKLAKTIFKKAFEQFCNAEESFKQKLEEITSPDEIEMAQKLFKDSNLRQKYCQARILMEEAKLLEREGKYLPSSKSYGEASQKIFTIVEKVDNEAERKELEYMAILCRAWEKMTVAEEATSSESYLEAAELFERAKDYCYTRKASLWALGNSNFCRGLAAGVKYQTKLDLREHSKAKSFMKNASTHYEKAGFKAAAEYTKATLRLFDAYLFMNQAESEADQEKRARQYQIAENLLQIAAGSFMKAKQPEKTNQVQEILDNVREEKALAISLSQVMQAPSIASSTLSFSAPSPTSESSIGLEKFEHANVQANLVTHVKEVKIGESFCLSVEFVNAGREPALLMRVDDFVSPDFVVVKKPEIYRIEESCLNMKGKQLAPLKLVEVKLTLQASKKGNYRLNPRVHYLDEKGQNKFLQLKTLEIQVEEVIMEDRVSTGTEELDSLLLGGIPKEYAVALTSSPCDERELLIKNFLRSGVEEGISFYVTTEANNLQDLLENQNFYLFLCNPKPKTEVPNLPNVYRLQGKTDLNNLGIALTKAYRSLKQNLVQPKRICVEILSEVLEDYESKTTRKWISDLITNYGAKGFTILAVMNPAMHPSEQATAVIDLFDGEISIIQSDDPLDCKKSILVKKLRNQDYIKNHICLR